MWSAIAEALKIFLEKHLIPTVISFVVAIVVLLKLPEEYWMIEKIGKTMFFILVLSVSFLVIQFIVFVYHNIQEKRISSYRKQINNIQAQNEEKENMDKLIGFINNLPPEERQMIVEFIQSGNTPKTYSGYRLRNPGSIFNTKAIVSIKNKDGSTSYKLHDDFYAVIKKIYEDKGRITYFD